MLLSRRIAIGFAPLALLAAPGPVSAGDVLAPLESGLDIARPGAAPERLDLRAALRVLRIPSVGVALIDRGVLAGAASYGGAGLRTLYQAASLSKLVTAVAPCGSSRRGGSASTAM